MVRRHAHVIPAQAGIQKSTRLSLAPDQIEARLFTGVTTQGANDHPCGGFEISAKGTSTCLLSTKTTIVPRFFRTRSTMPSRRKGIT